MTFLELKMHQWCAVLKRAAESCSFGAHNGEYGRFFVVY